MADENILSLEEMLAAEDIEYVVVPVPEWKGSVRLGSISAGEMLDFTEASQKTGNSRYATIRLVVQSLVGPDGERIAKTPEDIEKQIQMFKSKDIRVMNRLVDAAMKLNGVTVKKVAEIKNDSGEASTDASPIVLH